jgi:histidinol-phosphate aminotransferase
MIFAERLNSLTPYVPGEQPQERTYVKLNTNENPYPPAPGIRDLLRGYEYEQLRLYPDPLCGELRAAIADRYDVGTENVFVGNGSDEVLAFAFYAFFGPEAGPLLFPEFTYSFYPVYCTLYDIPFRRIPMGPDFTIDLEAFLDEPDSCGAIIANPNAPTGLALPADEIRGYLDRYTRDRAVIVDEAYVDFGAESVLDLTDEYENLLVVRTYSKAFSLAGARIGYAMGDRKLISALTTVKDSFNSYPLDGLSQKLGILAMEDTAYYDEILTKVIATRDDFAGRLRDAGWRVLPSKSNFVFASKPGLPGREVYERLRGEGYLVRYFDTPGIDDFVRITVGRPEEMDGLTACIGRLFDEYIRTGYR